VPTDILTTMLAAILTVLLTDRLTGKPELAVAVRDMGLPPKVWFSSGPKAMS
jgi:hypothetical protein